jgi:hypothetical protein
MKRRIVWILALVCAAALLPPAVPAAAQESPQTVKAAIPPQAPQATTPPAANVPPQARPPVVQPPVATPPRAEPAPAPKPLSEYEAANVRVEVTITYQVGTAAPVKRTATLTVADQGRGSLRAGTQVAVPSTTFQPVASGGPATNPITSINYKSVGLNVDAGNVYIQGNKARMSLSVEFSAIDEKPTTPAGTFPMFPTFSQSLTLVLESGKPIIVGQSSDVVDNVERKQTVEVKATILR